MAEEITLALLKRDIEAIKAATADVAAAQREIAEKQNVQALTCARTCASSLAAREALTRRQDALEARVKDDEKRINEIFGLNTALTALGTIIAAILGRQP